MNKKQAKKQVAIPGFIWAIVVILVLCIVFMFLVQKPFSEKIDTYNTEHDAAQSKITMYEDYLSRKEEVEKSIAEMKEKYNEESKKLFVNATQGPADIQRMVNNLKISLNNVDIADPGVDGEGRTSSTGDPLYVTSVSFNFEGTESELLDTLDYFELESDGSYYVESLTATPIVSLDANSRVVSLSLSDQKFHISVSLSLYFFPPKVDEVSNAPIVSGSEAAVSPAAATESSAASAA